MPKQTMSLKDVRFLSRKCLEYLEKHCQYQPQDRTELVNLPLDRFDHLHREDVALVQKLGKKYLYL